MTASAVTDAPRPRSATTRLVQVSSERVGAVAAEPIARLVAENPRAVLGVATGSSPLAVYAELARLAADGLDTSGLTLFALDEYVGLPAGDPRSYRAYVDAEIAAPLGIPAERVHVPAGEGAADAAAYEAAIAAAGGVDLQIVGIGRNGHIGFNEPGSAADSRTRVVELDDSTRAANAVHFGGDAEAVPRHAMTQGLATILSARRILLVAQGVSKAHALRAALEGPVTTDLPASLLQIHPDVTVVATADALSRPE